MTKARKDFLKPHTEFIVDLLARFKSLEQICVALSEKGIESTVEDLQPFTRGQYKKMIDKRSREIASGLSITKPEFVMMLLDELVHDPESSVADKLSAIRIRTAMMKHNEHEPTAEELLRDEE